MGGTILFLAKTASLSLPGFRLTPENRGIFAPPQIRRFAAIDENPLGSIAKQPLQPDVANSVPQVAV
jgi:hypothetical protein